MPGFMTSLPAREVCVLTCSRPKMFHPTPAPARREGAVRLAWLTSNMRKARLIYLVGASAARGYAFESLPRAVFQRGVRNVPRDIGPGPDIRLGLPVRDLLPAAA